MKKLTILITLATMALLSVACNDFQLNEPMEQATWLVCGGEYNKEENTTRRAFLVLMIEGMNEDAYTLEYTIDGMQGVGQFALNAIDEETATKVYNWQVFKGSEFMSEEMFSGTYNGNFPSGSSTKLSFINKRDKNYPSHGSTSFLSPKLEAGKHLLVYTITNSYGNVITGTREFEIKDKPNDL